MFPHASGHPSLLFLDPNTQSIYSITQTHIRQNNSPFLPKMDLEGKFPPPSEGISRLVQKNILKKTIENIKFKIILGLAFSLSQFY